MMLRVVFGNLLFCFLNLLCSSDSSILLHVAVVQPSWFLHNISLKEKTTVGLPGGTMVKNSPANAGDTGSSPAPRRSHMPRNNKACAPQLLSLRSTAHEPQLPSPHATATEARAPRARALQQEKPPQWEVRTGQQRVALACRN